MSTLNSDTTNATSNDMSRRRALTGALTTGLAGLASLAVAGAAQAQNAAPSVMPAKPLKGKRLVTPP
jgi:hypothetical protein